jgi:hypothetical protein
MIIIFQVIALGASLKASSYTDTVYMDSFIFSIDDDNIVDEDPFVGPDLSKERIAIINELRNDVLKSPDSIYDSVLAQFPRTDLTPDVVAEEVHRILLPIQVPAWFHRKLVDGSSAVTAETPPPSYADEETVEAIKNVWREHCIMPTELFPETPACYETMVTIDNVRMPGWKLSNEQIELYLENLALGEDAKFEPDDDQLDSLIMRMYIESLFGDDGGADLSQSTGYESSGPAFRQVLSESSREAVVSIVGSKRSSPHVGSEEPVAKSGRTSSETLASIASGETPTEMVSLYKGYVTRLLEDVSSNTRKIMDEIHNIAKGKEVEKVTPESLARHHLLSQMMRTAWFHSALSLSDPSENNLEAELKLWGSQNVKPELVSDADDWQKWCLKPLQSWSASISSSKLPAPCKTIFIEGATPTEWVVLSKEQMIEFLNTKLN